MKTFLQKNGILLLGLFLPLLFLLFFVGATKLPALFVANPSYDLLLVYYESVPNNDIQYRIRNKEGALHVQYKRVKEPQSGNPYGKIPHVLRVHADSGKIREMPITLFSGQTPEDDLWHDLMVPEFTTLEMSLEYLAPDGYEFLKSGSSYTPFEYTPFAGLFFSSSYRSNPFLEKGARRIRLSGGVIKNYFNHWNRGQFLGWIVKSRAQKRSPNGN